MKKSWKQIEDSRNTRLWITNVIIPVGMIGATIYASSEEVRTGINTGVKKTVKKVKRTINKAKTKIVNFNKEQS